MAASKQAVTLDSVTGGVRKLALCAVLVALVSTACGGGEEQETTAGIVRTPPPVVGDVSLPAVSSPDSAEFAFQAQPDELLLVYFGFTSCPDVCPTTLADLRSALRSLGDGAGAFDVAFATVDPGRDTVDRTVSYIQAFFPEGIALRTDDATALQTAADAFGVRFEVNEDEEGNVNVDHTAFLYAVDDAGLIRMQWPFGVTADAIAHDLELLTQGDQA